MTPGAWESMHHPAAGSAVWAVASGDGRTRPAPRVDYRGSRRLGLCVPFPIYLPGADRAWLGRVARSIAASYDVSCAVRNWAAFFDSDVVVNLRHVVTLVGAFGEIARTHLTRCGIRSFDTPRPVFLGTSELWPGSAVGGSVELLPVPPASELYYVAGGSTLVPAEEEDDEPPNLIEVTDDDGCAAFESRWQGDNPWLVHDVRVEHLVELLLPLLLQALIVSPGVTWISGHMTVSTSMPRVTAARASAIRRGVGPGMLHGLVECVPAFPLPPGLASRGREGVRPFDVRVAFVAHASAGGTVATPRWRVHHHYSALVKAYTSDPESVMSFTAPGALHEDDMGTHPGAGRVMSTDARGLMRHVASALTNSAMFPVCAEWISLMIGAVVFDYELSAPPRAEWAGRLLPAFGIGREVSSFQFVPEPLPPDPHAAGVLETWAASSRSGASVPVLETKALVPVAVPLLVRRVGDYEIHFMGLPSLMSSGNHVEDGRSATWDVLFRARFQDSGGSVWTHSTAVGEAVPALVVLRAPPTMLWFSVLEPTVGGAHARAVVVDPGWDPIRDSSEEPEEERPGYAPCREDW